jgi:hypothetical protein
VAWISKHEGASIVAFVTARKARGLKQTINPFPGRGAPTGVAGWSDCQEYAPF